MDNTGGIDVTWEPEEESVVDEFSEKETQGELDYALKKKTQTNKLFSMNYNDLRLINDSTGMRRACRKPMAFSRRWKSGLFRAMTGSLSRMSLPEMVISEERPLSLLPTSVESCDVHVNRKRS